METNLVFNIALIAHDSKKTLMEHFVLAYYKKLEKHNLFASGSTGELITRTVPLNVRCQSYGIDGGVQQITNRVAVGEIDVVIFFQDPFIDKFHENKADLELLRVCIGHNVPCASILATAELCIQAIENGDFNHLKYDKPELIYNHN
jgi:methylglyoxal synthase